MIDKFEFHPCFFLLVPCLVVEAISFANKQTLSLGGTTTSVLPPPCTYWLTTKPNEPAVKNQSTKARDESIAFQQQRQNYTRDSEAGVNGKLKCGQE